MILAQQEYDAALQSYIKDYLQIDNYIITEEEFGIIPMTNFPFPKGEEKIINMGTAGGHTKPSSGFTFRFIQKHAEAIVTALMGGERSPH
ncbi:MAG: lycopene cyclase family protein [Panacibacter sp.]